MQKHLKWVPLEERRARSRVVVLYKVVHQLVDIPVCLFVPNTRETRTHQQKFKVIPTKVKAYQYSFIPAAIGLWNNLPAQFVTAPSVDALRARLANTRLVEGAEY